jgi:hypothetical protein
MHSWLELYSVILKSSEVYMKIFTFFFTAAFCFSAMANEKVFCRSEDRQWEITLQLSSQSAQNIEFKKNGLVVKTVKLAEVNSYRYPRWMMNYNIDLDGSKYLNIVRGIKGKELLNDGSAAFLLTNNPFGFEKHAEVCKFSVD